MTDKTIEVSKSELETIFWVLTSLEDSCQGKLSSAEYLAIVNLARKVTTNPNWIEYFWRKGLEAQTREAKLEADLKRVA